MSHSGVFLSLPIRKIQALASGRRRSFFVDGREQGFIPFEHQEKQQFPGPVTNYCRALLVFSRSSTPNRKFRELASACQRTFECVILLFIIPVTLPMCVSTKSNSVAASWRDRVASVLAFHSGTCNTSCGVREDSRGESTSDSPRCILATGVLNSECDRYISLIGHRRRKRDPPTMLT